MKQFKKILIGVISFIMVVANTVPVMAANDQVEAQLKGDNVTYKAGEKAVLTITVKNTGDNDLSNITVWPEYSSSAAEWPFKEADRESHKKVINELKSGASAEVAYNLTTRDDVGSGRSRITFSISGVGEKEIQFTVFPFTQEPEKKKEIQEVENTNENAVNASIAANEGSGVYNVASDGSVPRVIVTGFTTEPANVKAGSDFKLVVHLRNTSKKTAVSNMVVDFSSPNEGTDESTSAPVFLPTSGSNTIYIEKIAVNGTKDVSIDMNAKADLVQKPYSLNIAMKYEDNNAGQFESESSISVPIKQDARFEFSEFEINPESISVGSEANVMCSMYNLGRIKLYNVKVSFEGQGISASDVFVGNVEPGATAAIDGMITGKEATAGDGKIKMTLTYEDEGGMVSTAEKEFELLVTEELTDEVFGNEGEGAADNKEISIGLIAAIAALIVIIAAVAFIILKRKKTKQEEGGLTDELDRYIEDEHWKP